MSPGVQPVSLFAYLLTKIWLRNKDTRGCLGTMHTSVDLLSPYG